MRAFLSIPQTDWENPEFIPLSPYLVLEQEGQVAFYNSGWVTPLACSRLEEVTQKDLQNAMKMPAVVPIYISAIRELPTTDLLSPDFLFWVRAWWMEAVVHLRAEGMVARVA